MTKKKKEKELPAHLELQRTHVVCGPDVNYNTNTMTSAHIYRPLGVDNSWDFEEFKQDFQLKVTRLEPEVMEFDMIGADPALANALRRILIAEVPTVCIEHVFVINNTSIVQDEVLAHRLGLVPLRIDPALLDPRSSDASASEKNTVVFKLDVTCKRQGDKLVKDKVLSGDLVWLPMGSEIPEETSCRFAAGQAHMFAADSEPRPVNDDILLAKLRPNQCIQLEAHCTLGTGKEHAKWSPVATAWYRLQPEVVLLKDDIPDDVAEELLKVGQDDPSVGALPATAFGGSRGNSLVAPGPLFFRDPASGQLRAGSARGNERHLEKLRRLLEQERFSEAVALRKRKDHFIFTIESTGVLPPEQLLAQAMQLLEDKAVRLANKL